MPQYEYACEECNLHFERSSKISDRNKAKCPSCSGKGTMLVSHGVTLGDEAAWINDEVRGTLQTEDQIRKNPITTRTEHNDFLRKNDLIEAG